MTGRVRSDGKVVRLAPQEHGDMLRSLARPYRLLPLILHDKYALRINHRSIRNLTRLSGHHILAA